MQIGLLTRIDDSGKWIKAIRIHLLSVCAYKEITNGLFALHRVFTSCGWCDLSGSCAGILALYALYVWQPSGIRHFSE